MNPLKKSFLVENLTIGEQYQFKVSAVNFNGESTSSDPLIVYSCIAPASPNAPFRIDGTATTITLQWTAPKYDGGCPLQGYKLFRDLGSGGAISTEVDPLSINNKPYLN